MGAFMILLDIVCGAVALYVLTRLFSSKLPLPLPPGPKRRPLIGNLLDMPSEKEWLTFAKWGEQYGDICSVSVFGQNFIILNSSKLAVDMLDKQGAIYSDRPVIPMGGELVGWKNTLVLVPYSQRFRNYRRLAHQLFGNAQLMKGFHPIEELETHRFLKRLLAKPDAFQDHIRKTAGAIILRISHGYEVKEGEDPFVSLADTAVDQFSKSTAPGGFLVNFLPALMNVPDWFPGTGFKQTAKEWARCLEEMVEQPFQFVKDQVASGTAPVSYTSSLLEEKKLTAEEEFEVKWSAASLYSGGADTTVATIHAFFKAMALFPEVQEKARAELDAVVGKGRLPNFEDRANLPYVNAIAFEAMRWHSVVPTAIPHRVLEDNIFQGYYIPKGTLVIPNLWKMTHDPEVYPEPMKFKPERFLATANHKPEPDPRDAMFGFGRRICPGRVLADASVFISCAMILHCFEIGMPKDGSTIINDQTTGTISHPVSFKCSIVPRSERAIALIQADENH
ncbi:cytochrome p450 [Moniliophthora roreri MCA 2997]|uniref:Cytochrome p450 n=2 Tax=Moniliophthora roreri TaxID=221103 RepID=V2X864_MONRO|nr:cytochrome p450 [Moniliophthora roreri MCA 2997]KAI3605819.1 cytochrome p450 [Moniliophthora roreri]